jgi:hypothetical protein
MHGESHGPQGPKPCQAPLTSTDNHPSLGLFRQTIANEHSMVPIFHFRIVL